MSRPIKKPLAQSPPAISKPAGTEKMSTILESRKSDELVIAFAGPVGCGIGLTISEAKSALESIGYEVHTIKLSGFISKSIEKAEINIDASAYQHHSETVKRILRLQDGGNKLREIGTSILAERAIAEIVVLRGQQGLAKGFAGEIKDYVPRRTAYLIDQIKHQDEVTLLRIVYGKLFHLIGVISVAEKRKARLRTSDRVSASEISELMERDRRQEDSNGQQLDKALQMADFFLSTDHGTTPSLQRKLKRFLGLLHGENGITPTAQEYGMYAAFSAGLKSACLSRQVGAAIADQTGKIVSTGCNDVPKPTGGLYTSEDQGRDQRCVHKEEQICFNDREKMTHKDDIAGALRSLMLPDEVTRLIPEERLPQALEAVYNASHIGDLTEFSRAVHAEMDAIISLARTGTPGIVGAKLFTTTFPCHSCARHIVAAGISTVYYIEPYEKSLAQKLHSDAIAFETEDDDEEKNGYTIPPSHSLVRFVHFEGVAPSQYPIFFKMAARKDSGTGRVIKIMPTNAKKAVGEYLDDYKSFEAKVVERVQQTVVPGTALVVVADASTPKF